MNVNQTYLNWRVSMSACVIGVGLSLLLNNSEAGTKGELRS